MKDEGGSNEGGGMSDEKRRKYIKYGIFGGIGLIILILAIVLPLTLGGKKKPDPTPPIPPPPPPIIPAG
jgi:N-terminal barrel of NtMGAM and CtMGAM, maltase-glucoamylase